MMELAADPGLNILTYSAEPGSRSEEALNPGKAASVEGEASAG